MSLLAIDGMGGDKGPKVVVHGLALFHERCPKSSFLLYGNSEILAPLLARHKLLAEVTKVVHTTQEISQETTSLQALRSLKEASMRLALEAVASGQAQGVVSAGNTGAYMGLSSMIFRPLEGIHRPAIVSLVPTQRGQSVMLDLGGNIKASAQNLVDYGIMGSLFAQHVLGLSRPSIGLLNVGTEAHKGTDVLQTAASLLGNTTVNFHGFIEGHDIALGTVDVVVTDGFTGNIALKTGEGVMNLFAASLKKTLQSTLRGKIAALWAAPLLQELKNHFDPRCYNGALWLGFDAVAVKSHGGTDALGFAHAVEIAHDMVQANITSVLATHLKALHQETAIRVVE